MQILRCVRFFFQNMKVTCEWISNKISICTGSISFLFVQLSKLYFFHLCSKEALTLIMQFLLIFWYFLSVQVSFEKDKVFETGICSVIYYGAYLDIYLFKNLKSSSTFSEQQQGWTIFSWRRGSWEGYVTNFTKLAWMVHLGILKV